ncbi:MAG: DUF3237 domain-containing protein [Paracoccaceae bacterium]
MITNPALPAPKLGFFCDLHVELGTPHELGNGRSGTRRIIPIIGGRVEGPELSGRILSLGADWQTIFPDGLALLDTRYAFETDDGALIEIVNYGHRIGPAEMMRKVAAGEAVAPDSYYMRTQARLETGDPRYAWVNRKLFVGTGARMASSVTVSLFVVE